MGRPICAFVVRKPESQVFTHQGPKDPILHGYKHFLLLEIHIQVLKQRPMTQM